MPQRYEVSFKIQNKININSKLINSKFKINKCKFKIYKFLDALAPRRAVKRGTKFKINKSKIQKKQIAKRHLRKKKGAPNGFGALSQVTLS